MPKIFIMGAGEIGSKTLLTILKIFPKNQFLEIVFYNRSYKKALGESMDIAGYIDDEDFSEDRIGSRNRSDYIAVKIGKDLREDISNSDVIIYTIGVSAAQIGSSYREASLPFIYNAITEHGKIIKEKAPTALILMITNPVDISTWLMKEATGFSSNQILGSGTELDSRRFRRALKDEIWKKTGVTAKDIRATVIGGHSESEMIVVKNSILIDGLSLYKFCETYKIDNDVITDLIAVADHRMRKEGFELIKLKGWGASYEPALLLSSMARAYLLGPKIKLSATKFLDFSKGESYLDLSNCTLSIPLIIEKGKIAIDDSVIIEKSEISALEEVSLSHKKMFQLISNMSKDNLFDKISEELKARVRLLDVKNGLLDELIQKFESKISPSTSPSKPILPDCSIYSVSSGEEYSSINISVKNKDTPPEIQIYLLRLFADSAEKMGIDSINLDKENVVLKLPNNSRCNDLLLSSGLKLEGNLKSRL